MRVARGRSPRPGEQVALAMSAIRRGLLALLSL
jgi:hypothetical protein